jgi:hypothetical protein
VQQGGSDVCGREQRRPTYDHLWSLTVRQARLLQRRRNLLQLVRSNSAHYKQ